MKTLLLLLFTAAAAFAAQPLAELKLNDGRILKNVRFVAIKGDTVSLIHSKGAENVPAAQIDLEILARAQMELSATEGERKQRAEDATRRAAEEVAKRDQDKQDEINARLAMAKARDDAASRTVAAPAGKKAAASGPSIDALKAAFPDRAKGNARVFIPKSGQNQKPYIVSSTVSTLPGGATYSSTTTHHNEGKGRVDTIQYDAPADDVWRWYKGAFQTTTLDALPRTLQMVEARLREDTQKMQAASGSLQASTAAQAQHTLYWFDKSLRPHIEQWRALLK